MCSRFQGSMEAVLPAAMQLRQMVADWQSTLPPPPAPSREEPARSFPGFT